MPLDRIEAFAAVGALLHIVGTFVKALGKASAGGRKITPDEWTGIKSEFEGWFETTARDYVD